MADEPKTASGMELGQIISSVEVALSSRSTLKTRWDTDFDLWRQLEYKAGKGYFSYTSNSARVLADKVMSLLTTARLLFQIPPEDLTVDERKLSSQIERFLYGALTLNDRRLKALNQPILRDALAWLFLIRGGAAIRTFVNKDASGKTKVEIVPWDLYSTAYRIGADGLEWAVHKRMATRQSIVEEYPNLTIAPPKPITFWSKLFGAGGKPSDDLPVYDFWDKKVNGIIVGSEWAKEPEEHGCKRCPIDIILVGGMPSILSSQGTIETEAYRGESIFAANRKLYPIINKTMSDYLTLVRRGVKAPIQYASATGTKTIDVDIYQSEKAAVVSTERDDIIKPILPETMPKDAEGLMSFLMSEIQRGGLSHISMGELNFRLSGYAISELQQTLITTIAPFVQAMEKAYESTADALIEQFASGGYKPIEVMGHTSQGIAFGYPKPEKIKTSDLKADWRPTVKLAAQLPKDDAQRVQLANILRQGERPLLSDRDILENYLEVQDPDLALQRIDEQWGNNIPMIKLQRTFQAYVEAGEFHKALLVYKEMQKLMMAMEAQLPGATPITGGGGAMGGLSPETLPVEQLGGVPPGAEGAAPVEEVR